MNKLSIGILTGLVVIIGLLINLTNIIKNSPKKFGVRPEAAISSVASSTATYFRGNNNDPTATTTILTVAGVHFADVVEIGIIANASTSPVGSVKTQVEISQDASTWYPVSFESVTNTGSQVAEITLNATSTIFTFATVANGTYTIRLPQLRRIAAQYLHVRAWTSASTTLLATAFLLSQ